MRIDHHTIVGSNARQHAGTLHRRRGGTEAGYLADTAIDREEGSRYFSRFLIASRRPTARRWPEDSILCAGAVWYPVDLAQPDHTPARGQPSREPARA
jgi:hypothetical protein